MNRRIPHALAALLVAGATPFALAQTATSAPESAPPPVAQQSAPTDLVSAPIASASRTDGPDAEIVSNIVNALVADPAMSGTKLTVQPDNGTVTLTGTTSTRAQVKRAGEIALQFAGEGKVVNAIQPSEI